MGWRARKRLSRMMGFDGAREREVSFHGEEAEEARTREFVYTAHACIMNLWRGAQQIMDIKDPWIRCHNPFFGQHKSDLDQLLHSVSILLNKRTDYLHIIFYIKQSMFRLHKVIDSISDNLISCRTLEFKLDIFLLDVK
ncbi:hypothetical protein ACJX0J_014000, partial [Zea mays]